MVPAPHGGDPVPPAVYGATRTRIIKPTISQHVGLVWLKGDPTLPMTKAVVELMEDALNRGLVSRERV